MTNRDITITYSKSDLWWKTTLEDLWVTILEGGSNYWVDGIYYDKSEVSLKNGENLAENFEVKIYHGADEFDSRIMIDLYLKVFCEIFAVIYDGIKLLSDDVKMTIMNNGDWDANDADHIFQLGVFGEVRYG